MEKTPTVGTAMIPWMWRYIVYGGRLRSGLEIHYLENLTFDLPQPKCHRLRNNSQLAQQRFPEHIDVQFMTNHLFLHIWHWHAFPVGNLPLDHVAKPPTVVTVMIPWTHGYRVYGVSVAELGGCDWFLTPRIRIRKMTDWFGAAWTSGLWDPKPCILSTNHYFLSVRGSGAIWR